MTDPDARVQAAAAVAYGKIGQPIPLVASPGGRAGVLRPALRPAEANNDKDPYLRHAAVMGLVHAARNPVDLWNVWTLGEDEASTTCPPVRMGVLLALRKHKSEKVAEFLTDSEPRIVAEAARAIYDDRMMNAFPIAGEARGQAGAAGRGRVPRAGRELLARHARSRGAHRHVRRHARAKPDYIRAFALKLLARLGRSRPRAIRSPGSRMDLAKRDAKVAADALKAVGVGIFAGSDVVRREAAQVVAKLGIKEFGPAMAALVKDAKQPDEPSRRSAACGRCLKDPGRRNWPRSRSATDRTEAPRRRPRGAGAARTGRGAEGTAGAAERRKVSFVEKQGAFAILAAQRSSEEADKLLDEWLDRALAGKVPAELVLDVLDAAETRASTPKLKLFAPLKQKVDKYRAAQTRSRRSEGRQARPVPRILAGGDAEKGPQHLPQQLRGVLPAVPQARRPGRRGRSRSSTDSRPTRRRTAATCSNRSCCRARRSPRGSTR